MGFQFRLWTVYRLSIGDAVYQISFDPQKRRKGKVIVYSFTTFTVRFMFLLSQFNIMVSESMHLQESAHLQASMQNKWLHMFKGI